MRLTCPLRFALPILLCTCGPATSLPPDDGEYINAGAPDTTVTGDPAYAGRRLVVRGDSATLFDPVYGTRDWLPFYAAAGNAATDSVYLTYERLNDDRLSVRVVGSDEDAEIPPQLYTYYAAPRRYVPGEEVRGKTYRFDVEGVPVLLYFQAPNYPLPSLLTREEDNTATYEFRRTQPVSNPEGGQTSNLAYVEKVAENRVLVHRLLVMATEKGVPQLYLREDRLHEPGRVRGPFIGTLYPSVVPESEADQNLFMQLSRGRIEVQPLPPEPATDSLATAYDEDSFVRTGGLTVAEVQQLDIEFREDGTYVLLTGNRILEEAEWTLTADRNFVIFVRPRSFGMVDLRPIMAYTDDYFSFRIPVKVKTRRQDVRDRIAYYETEAELRFYREDQ